MSVQPVSNARVAATIHQAENYTSPSKSELEKMARDLHAVGDIRHHKDDYDKRLAALANDFLPKLHGDDQKRFMDTITELDGGARGSWLQGGRLDDLVKQGRVSEGNRDALVDVVPDLKVKSESDSINFDRPGKSDFEKMADELHSVGDIKHKKDDYDKRLTSLANHYLPKLSKENQGKFLDTILEKDKGALDSWLQGDRLAKLVKDGRVSAGKQHDLLDGFAKGYNSKQSHVNKDVAWKFFGMDGSKKGYVQKSGIMYQRNGGGWENKNTSLSIYDQLTSGLKGPDGKISDEFSTFLKNFTTDEIRQGDGKIHGDKYSADHGKELSVLFNAANQAGDNQKTIADIFNGLNEKQRATVTEDLSRTFTDQSEINDALLDQHKANKNYVDPMTLLIKAVANDTSDATKESDGHLGTPGELAKYVYDHSKNKTWSGNEFYDDKNIPLAGRQKALSGLMKNHASAIMDGISNYRDAPNGMTQLEWLAEGRGILSNMERLTGLAPENKDGQEILSKIADKSNGWLKGDGNHSEDWANHQVANVIASTEQAVKQGFADKAEDDAAKKADLMRMVNVITGLLGVGVGKVTGKISSEVTSMLEKNLGEDIASQVKDWASQGFDSLSDEAKEKFVDKIIENGDQDAYLDTFRENASEFVSTELLSQLDQSTTEGRDRADVIMDEASQYSTDPR